MSTRAAVLERAPRLYLSFAIAAIVAAAAVPYLPAIDDYFIRDDFGVVQLLASKPADYFPAWFYTSWMDNIWGFLPDEVRPFPAVSYQLTALAGAGNPAGHHVFNIALHAANGLLVFAIARAVTRLRLAYAALAAVIFVLLPVQAESVAWITGRVDSMPALFYLASFLCFARWRERGGAPWYVLSTLLFFVALFTKQTAITMVATLVAYDVLLAAGHGVSLSKKAVAYVPFVLLTIGYLILRVLLFGQAVREEQLTTQGLRQFALLADRHLARVVVGDADGSRLLLWVLIAVVAGAAARPRWNPAAGRLVLFFGVAWWLIGIAPVAVAGYESPRHVYLASMAWPMLVGLAFESFHQLTANDAKLLRLRFAFGLILLAYPVVLYGVVREWSAMARVSERATDQLARESRLTPPGTLLVAGVPPRSWEWALPFAVQPPFTGTDVTTRTLIISPRELYCCRPQWFEDTRRTLRAWASGPGRGSVVAIRIGERTAAVARLSSAEQPSLPAIARTLLEVEDADLLDLSIRRLLDSLPGGS